LFPIYLGGSCFSDKPNPDDIELVLDLRAQAQTVQLVALKLWQHDHARLKQTYEVDFMNLIRDFTAFFRYVGIKTGAVKQLDPKDKRES
jgi:hypothetical protein